MDFFEEALSKAKDVFDVACKKTGEAVNSGKIKIDIAALENKLSKDFESLGRTYFEQLKDTHCEGNLQALKNSILEKQAKIDLLKKELENK